MGAKTMSEATVEYADTTDAEWRERPIDVRPYLTVHGYTKQYGAPSSWMVRLDGSKVWRRVYIYQISNAGSAFVRVAGRQLFVPDHAFPTS